MRHSKGLDRTAARLRQNLPSIEIHSHPRLARLESSNNPHPHPQISASSRSHYLARSRLFVPKNSRSFQQLACSGIERTTSNINQDFSALLRQSTYTSSPYKPTIHSLGLIGISFANLVHLSKLFDSAQTNILFRCRS